MNITAGEKLFVDAHFWIALFSETDGHNTFARNLWKTLEKENYLVTSELVLTELLDGIVEYPESFKIRVVKHIRGLYYLPRLEIVGVDTVEWRYTLDYLEKRANQEWGFTDCSSFRIMEARGILKALTNDHHFEQAKFVKIY